jgi:hypothetical protein
MVLAARHRRCLHGDAIERQVHDAAVRARGGTLMRYFLRRRLGPLAVAMLAVGGPEPAGTSPGEPAARLPDRTLAGVLAA